MAITARQRLDRIRSAIDQYQGRLIAYAAGLTGSLDAGRDVVQDTFLRLCEQDLEQVADHLAAWLFRVCRNRALDVRRKEDPMQPLDAAGTPAGTSPDPHALAEQGQAVRQALAALAALPAAQQEVLRLRFQQELSYKEISVVTGRTVSNVGVLIHTGIRQLRRELVPAPAPRPARQGDPDAQ